MNYHELYITIVLRTIIHELGPMYLDFHLFLSADETQSWYKKLHFISRISLSPIIAAVSVIVLLPHSCRFVVKYL